jgi:hypothetical protein
MKTDGLLKHIGPVFLVALILYVVAYSGIEHRRTRKGPWVVTFTTNGDNEASLIIDQSVLGLSNVFIVFSGTRPPTNVSGAVLRFDQPRPVPYDVPFGRCLFMDTTFLPGTIVLNMFGHEIQLIPRVLTVDRKEYPWPTNRTFMIESKTNDVEHAAPTP